MAGRRNGRGDAAVQVRQVNLAEGETMPMILNPVPPPEPPTDNPALRLHDLDRKPEVIQGKHLLIILGNNEPSKRIVQQVQDLVVNGMDIDFIRDMAKLSGADRERLGLKDQEDAGTPYVYFFDEAGVLLFSQSGYDLNLPNRVRNTLR